jgi:hypothetical protein
MTKEVATESGVVCVVLLFRLGMTKEEVASESGVVCAVL